MKRLFPWILIVLTALPACAASKQATTAEREALPNIILAMADDQGCGDVGFMGSAVKTPVLDEMAKTCLRLDRFYSASPVCSPTRGSVLTGRHPNRFGCLMWGHELRPSEVTLAEALKTAGYATGHFGKWHLGPVDRFGPNSPNTSGFDTYLSAPNFYENDVLMSQDGKVIQTEGESSMIAVDAALEFIEKAERDGKPFLAVIWFGNPHSPHVPTKELAALYPDQDEKHRNYYGEITGIDRAMGKLRRQLRAMNIADNTLLWYTSDNGPRPVGSTAGLRGWKGQLWEGGIRVPCLIEWPARLRTPRRSDVPAFTSDIYPTLCELTGIRVPGQKKPLDGVSLVPLFNGQMTQRGKPMGFWHYPIGGRSAYAPTLMKQLMEDQATDPHARQQHKSEPASPDRLEIAGHAAWIDGDWKLHRIPEKKSTSFRLELYNLADDPDESENLAETQPQRTQRMLKALEQWQQSVARSYAEE